MVRKQDPHRTDFDEAARIVDGLRQATDQQLEEICQQAKWLLEEDEYLKIDYDDLVKLVALGFHLDALIE